MIAFDPVNKVVMTFVVGKRNQKEIDLLIRTVRERTDSNIPHFTSDELESYFGYKLHQKPISITALYAK